MKNTIAPAVLCALISGCGPSKSDIASAYKDLKDNQVEIRMGHLPELGEAKCDRNMYAAYRTDQAETVTFNLEMFVMQPGVPTQRYERQLELTPLKKSGLVVGQTRLFPVPLEAPCKEVLVQMTTMTCTYGKTNEKRNCPGKIRWNWLQGFKMIETPSTQ